LELGVCPAAAPLICNSMPHAQHHCRWASVLFPGCFSRTSPPRP
jgi:hypothetical protein